jgi:excisionase family DNA binding protein
MNQSHDQLLLTQDGAAKALAVSPRTVFNLIAKGELRAVRIGRAVRIDTRDLLAFIDRTKGAEKSAQ